MSELVPVVGIFSALVFASLVEGALPFRRAFAAPAGRRRANLILTIATIALNLLLNAGVASFLLSAANRGVGLFNNIAAPPYLETASTVIFLDLAFYISHVAMHKSPLLWRFHRIHHLDGMVDASTSFRQHPGEGLLRCVFIGGAAALIGASPAAFAVYRVLSAANAILEHANVTAPMPLARAMAWITSWPHYHKIHHSAAAPETDSNYGNLFTIWDRLFATHTPVERAPFVAYGLAAERQRESAVGLLIDPFRKRSCIK
ncbi:MAG TPA: sterol desaturase family protein [Parvularculaceae bacterium]|nr:sterol desaturase family protein [Parvularculaceae bacterium]